MRNIFLNLRRLPANTGGQIAVDAKADFVRNGRSIALLFMLLCFLLAVPGIVSAAEVSEKQTVRVGFFQFDGYHDMSEDGVRSGYGYDFLRMIAPYAGFEYEYIGYNKSWSEMLQMLEDGQIDLLTSGQKTPEREEKYDFSRYSIGKSAAMLTTRADNSCYSVEDYSTFDGIRVGLLEGNSRNKSFENYAREKGFSYKAVYYDDQLQMLEALSQGDNIDAIVTSDLRALEDEIIIDKFDASDYYVMVRKGDQALLDKVNRAIESLNRDIPDWMTTLTQKYYSASTDGTSEVLTVRERDYLKSLSESGNALTVLLNPDRAPYSYFENGEAKGIYADLWRDIAQRYGFSYRFIETASTEEYMDIISRGAAAIVFDSAFDNASAEKLGYYITPSYSTATFSCLFDIDEDKKARSIAVKRSTPDVNKNYSALYEGMDVLEFDSYDECVQAVKEGKADCTYVYTYTAAKYVSEDVTGILSYTPVNNLTTDFSIAVQQDQDPMLYSLMTRVAKSLNGDHVQAAIDLNTRFVSTSNPLSYFLHRHPFGIAVSIVCVFLLILSMILGLAHRERVRNQKQREWEKKQRYALSEAFEAANRANEAKSEFLSKISHDIRTPMNAIIGMTAIAHAQLDDKARVADCLNKITMSSQHLLGLINEVLDMSKIESRKFSLSEGNFNLAELIDNLVDLVQPGIREKHHALTVHVTPMAHENVIGDFTRLQQVFINIVGNSIKYTPPGGRIEVEAEELTKKTDKIGTYRFIFRDNGIGMSEEFQKTIFDPFTREKKSSVDKIQGTGLGMAISKNIVQMMGGSIEVQSNLGKGSTFTLVVRLKLQDTEIPTDAALAGLPVLVVDDDESICESACILLKELGMESSYVLGGRDAVRTVVQHHEIQDDFYAVLLDWKMPDMDGIAAAREIRDAVGAEIPIIVLSAYDWSEIETDAKAAGINAFISKPLFKSKLLATFRSLSQHETAIKKTASLVEFDTLDFSGRTVLLVEDNELNREIAREILTMTGLRVEEAVDGKDCVDKVSASADGYYDLIFMDIQMPNMNGYDAAMAVRALDDRKDVKTMPIIAMTANAFVEDVEKAIGSRMNDHLAKPLELDKLSAVLKKWLP